MTDEKCVLLTLVAVLFYPQVKRQEKNISAEARALLIAIIFSPFHSCYPIHNNRFYIKIKNIKI